MAQSQPVNTLSAQDPVPDDEADEDVHELLKEHTHDKYNSTFTSFYQGVNI